MTRLKSAGFGILAATVMLILGSSLAPCYVRAQGGCVENCRAAYGACYKSTANRAACEAQLQRCMQGCIASKRG